MSYDNWFATNLANLIKAIELQQTIPEIQKVVSEIQRGITYASENPGSVNPLLVRMGEGLLGPVLLTYKLDSGTVSDKKSVDINISELKQALGNREKDKVINKMSGSLKALEDFES